MNGRGPAAAAVRRLSVLSMLLLLCVLAAAKEPVTIYLAGDSTMARKVPEKRPETGWGEFLERHFEEGRVRVENRAQNGRSTRTFAEQKFWQGILDDLRRGDYVLIQFGHNDSAQDRPDRYTPPADYRKNLIRFVAEVRAKRATPVLLTPVVRRRFDKAGAFYDVHGEYPDIVRAVAAAEKVPLIEMHRRSEQVLRRYGVEGSKKLFLQLKAGEHPNYPNGVEDNTHFSPLGAEEMAALAADAIREHRLGLAKHLKKTTNAER